MIAITLPAGEGLQEHQVHERAWMVVACRRGGGRGGRPDRGRRLWLRRALRSQGAPRGARQDRRARDPAARAVAGRGASRASASIRGEWTPRESASCGSSWRSPPPFCSPPPSSTRASAPPRRPASRAELQPGRSYDVTGKVVHGLDPAQRRRPALPHPRPRRHGVRPGHLHRRRARPVPRGPRGDRLRASSSSGTFVAERDSLVTKCPSKFTAKRRVLELSGRRRLRLPRRRAADGALRRRRLALRRPQRAPRVGRLGPPRDLLRWPACCVVAFGLLEVGVPALGLLVRAGRRELLDRHADLLQGHRACGPRRRARCCCGPCCCRCVASAGAVPHAPLAARRSRPTRPPCSARLRRLLPAADVRLGEPVRHARHAAGRGRRPEPAAAPPGDDDPPADALHGLRAASRSRSRSRSARSSRAAPAPTGSAPRAASRSPPGSSSASGSCSARAGPTPSSAGAATGPGIRSRTRR